jgi:SSS family transporter
MTTTDFWVIGAFALLIVLIGVSFSKTSGKDMKSFFAAGGEVPWWINSISLFMGFVSAGTFVVWGSIAYSSGWVAITIQWTMLIAGLLVGFITAPKWHKTKSLTAAEFITFRLGEKVQKTYSYLYLAVMVFMTGTYLYAVGRILEVSSGISLTTSIVSLGVLVIIYTTLGGLWAVVVTDVLQFVILITATIILFPLSLSKIGGVASFLSSAKTEGLLQFTNHEYTWTFLIAFALYNFFYLSGQYGFVQRYTSVKTPKDSRKVGFMFGAFYLILPIIWMVPPMIYRTINPGLVGLQNEGAFLMMCKDVLPAGMIGLMLVALIMASNSSLQAVLNISSGVITNDLYKIIYPKSTEKRLLIVAKIANLFFGLLMIGLALLIPFMGGVTNVVISIGSLTGAPMYLPILWALFSKKQNGKSAMIITVVSLIAMFALKFLTPVVFNYTFPIAYEMAWSIIIPAIAILVSEFWLRKINYNDKAYIDYVAYQQKKTKEQIDNSDEAQAENKQGIRMIGVGIVVTGIIISVLGILGSTGKIFVISLGGVLTVLGGAIFFRFIKKSK